jgi:hypothetical protein
LCIAQTLAGLVRIKLALSLDLLLPRFVLIGHNGFLALLVVTIEFALEQAGTAVLAQITVKLCIFRHELTPSLIITCGTIATATPSSHQSQNKNSFSHEASPASILTKRYHVLSRV